MLNVNMIKTGSSDVSRWRLKEPYRGDVQRRRGGIVLYQKRYEEF